MVILKCIKCGRTKKVKAVNPRGVRYIYSQRKPDTCFVCDYRESDKR